MSLYYIPAEDLIIDSYEVLRRRFPNVSLPRNKDMPELGVWLIHYTDQPEIDWEVQTLEQGTPEWNEEEQTYYQTWVIIDITQPEE